MHQPPTSAPGVLGPELPKGAHLGLRQAGGHWAGWTHGEQVDVPLLCPTDQQPSVSSSHRSWPCLPPSAHSERLSLANPGAFGDRCSLLPRSLCWSSQGALSLRCVSLLCPGHPASLPWPVGWVTPSLLGTWCPQMCWSSTLSPRGWRWAPRTHLTPRASQTQDFLKGRIW